MKLWTHLIQSHLSYLLVIALTTVCTASASTMITPPHQADLAKLLDLKKAWELTHGSPSIQVAILGTGVNYRLPDIQNFIAVNPNASKGWRGYRNDVYGIDASAHTSNPHDDSGLGTYEASLIASRQYGVAPKVKVIPIKVCDANGGCNTSAVLEGLEYAKARGAQVIYMGLGGGNGDVVCKAIEATGLPVVVSAGSEGADLSANQGRGFPAGCSAPNLILVAATDTRHKLAGFSNFGSQHVHLAAPGVNIPGLGMLGEVAIHSGTSVSAAIAAGVAALVLSLRPQLSPMELAGALISGSILSPNLLNKVISKGHLNAFQAIRTRVPR